MGMKVPPGLEAEILRRCGEDSAPVPSGPMPTVARANVDVPANAVRLILPYPPSMNRIWRSIVIKGQVRVLLSKEGREYREEVGIYLARAGRPHLLGRIALHITAHVPDKARRDLDNVCKASLDAMEHGGLYDNDGQIDELVIRRGVLRPHGQLDVAAWTIGELQRSLFEEKAVVR